MKKGISKSETAVFEKIIIDFICNMKSNYSEIADMAKTFSAADIFHQFDIFCEKNIHGLQKSIIECCSPVTFKRKRGTLIRQKFMKKIPKKWKMHYSESLIVHAVVDFIFHGIFPGNDSLNSIFTQIKSEYIESVSAKIVEENLEDLLDAMRYAQYVETLDDPYVFLSHIFPTTWSPLVLELNKKGKHTIWIGTEEHEEIEVYGALENKNIPTKEIKVLSFLGVICFLALVKNKKLILNGESFYGAGWQYEKAVVLYSVMSIVMKTQQAIYPEKQNLTILMYDGIKPIKAYRKNGGDKNHRKSLLEFQYKKMMSQPNRIIYNSNGECFGDFIENTLSIHSPRLHFMRYSPEVTNIIPKIKYGKNRDLHIVCITMCLGEFHEPSRDGVDQYVRRMLNSGIHFHYYGMSNNKGIEKFIASLSEQAATYFHLHPIEKDQKKLLEDIQRYHIGFNPADHIPFADGIVNIENRFYRDALTLFWQSTFATSFLMYSAAGLPVIMPRGCVAAQEFLGKDVSLAMTFSEIKNLPEILKRNDYTINMRAAEKNRYNSCISTHIDKFINFMNETPNYKK